jgi:heme o synthase
MRAAVMPVTKKFYPLMQEETTGNTSSFTLASKLRDYMMLVKFSLTFMVVFSAVISYLLAPKIVGFNAKMIRMH